MAEAESPLEEVWENREEVVYPGLFGPKSNGIFALTMDLFTETLKQTEVDPRWLHHGVLEFEPTPERNSWIYVTSGLSNPWETAPEDCAASEFSGLGTELVFETSEQAPWALEATGRLLGFTILLAHGRFGDLPALDYGHRIPLGGPITGDSTLRHVVVAEPEHYAASFDLKSGQVDLLHLVAVSDEELAFAKEQTTAALVDRLRAAGAFPVTDPARASII